MWTLAGTGLLTGLALIVAIGAQNAFVLRQGVRREHVGAVVLVCMASDAVLILAGTAGVGALVQAVPWLLEVLRWGGALYLLWFAVSSLRAALRPQGLVAEQAPRTAGSVIATTLALTWLNPHVYLDTVLLIGSLGAQQSVPGAYVIGAASASLLWFFTLALGAAWLAPWLARPGTWRLLDLLVAVMMYAVAVQLIVVG